MQSETCLCNGQLLVVLLHTVSDHLQLGLRTIKTANASLNMVRTMKSVRLISMVDAATLYLAPLSSSSS